MKKWVALSLVLVTTALSAQWQMEEIQNPLMNYINGSSYNDSEIIQSAFYEEAELFLFKEGQDIFVMRPREYAELFQNRNKGKFNGREGKILSIDFTNNIALAKNVKSLLRGPLYYNSNRKKQRFW